MTRDAFGLSSSTSSAAAGVAFEEAVLSLAGHRHTTGAALGRALSADPSHVGALALKGFANLILAREELVPSATEALGSARLAISANNGATEDEHILVAALGTAATGHFAKAADVLDQGFADRPSALLPFKLSHSLRFMVGDKAGMLAASTHMLDDWSEDRPGAGFLLGCHAFGLEEHGHYAAAEAFGQRAVRLEPTDAWGLHAVSHVHEMRGALTEGIDWLENGRDGWSRCNNFSYHLAWHLSLLHLERGDIVRVLELYDDEVRPEQTDDVRDVANAVSLLWRLNLKGIDVGGRWRDLAEIAHRRRKDTTLVFASLHTLMVLVATGDRAAADDLVLALEQRAEGSDDQARAARDVGLPLARVILGTGRHDRAVLNRLSLSLPLIGGSNAQRDLFVLSLAEAAQRHNDTGSLHRIHIARSQLKSEDSLIACIEDRAVNYARTA
jgi:hypothetical protein